MLVPINASAAGDTTLVAAVAGKKIRVRRAVLVNQVATANNVKFRTGGVDLHAAIALPLAIGPGISLDGLGDELQTTAGTLLAINLSAATAVTGYVIYTLE